VIQDLFDSKCIKGTGESTLVMDSPVPLMHHDPKRSWITDPDPDHPKGMQPLVMAWRARQTTMIVDTAPAFHSSESVLFITDLNTTSLLERSLTAVTSFASSHLRH